MEDIVQIRLLFRAGLLGMSGAMALIAYGITWLQGRLERRAGLAGGRTPRAGMMDAPVGGTR
jgi:hypothetical protein